MSKPTPKQIQACKDPFVREPLLKGADLNDFCTGCLTNTAHEACTGKSGMVAGQGFSVECVCDCPTAKAKRRLGPPSSRGGVGGWQPPSADGDEGGGT